MNRHVTSTRVLSFLLLCMAIAACDRSGAPGQASAPPVAAPPASEERAAADLYGEYCARCHEGGVPKAPHSIVFQMIGPEAVLKSMTAGSMQLESEQMTADEKLRLAEFLGGSSLGSAEEVALHRCGEAVPAADFEQFSAIADWGMSPANSRFVATAEAGLQLHDVPDLALKWAFAYPNATRARSQPTVAGNSVFMGSQDGTVYALDLDSGCVRWTFEADAEVRSAVSIEPAAPGGDSAPRAYFGDFIGKVYALDARTGALLWKSSLDDHHNVTITGSPKLHDNRLYVPMSSTEWASAADPAYECCTFRGGIAAFDTADGRKVWKSYTIPDEPEPAGQNSAGARSWAPAGAPVWGSLTIDEKRGLVYAPTGQGYTSPAVPTSDSIIAFDLRTGDMKWVFQATRGDAWNMSCFIGEAANCPAEDGPDYDFGAPPVLLTLSSGRDVLLAGQKSGFVFALDPDRNGALLWKKRVGLGGFAGGVHWGMAAGTDTLYAPNADTNYINKWHGERTPGLYALAAETGEEIWFAPAPLVCAEEHKPACDPGFSAAVTAIPGVVFAGGFDGHLRAYDSATGTMVWDFDTHREFETLSGETARGGSIESDGPVISAGTLLVNSGYLFGGRMGGNVLLAFSVGGE